MSDFFRAHQAVGTTIPTYFIESTAPNNVDDTLVVPKILPPDLEPIDPDLAVRQIASALANAPDPNLVVMVHGFNNPEPDVLRMYTAAARAIEADAAIRGRQGLVCVGYRWPSEKIGQPFHGTWDALPTLPTWILYSGAVLAVLLVSCVNVANLQLGRAVARRRELATRVALGATRWQLLRHLLAETLILALPGGALVRRHQHDPGAVRCVPPPGSCSKRLWRARFHAAAA